MESHERMIDKVRKYKNEASRLKAEKADVESRAAESVRQMGEQLSQMQAFAVGRIEVSKLVIFYIVWSHDNFLSLNKLFYNYIHCFFYSVLFQIDSGEGVDGRASTIGRSEVVLALRSVLSRLL